jgi:periplasmic divalent cation tolerance protein|tara:strand:- start:1874 stop:2173 length:300 start_codon:yes stop_codon:yes gene_type:complete
MILLYVVCKNYQEAKMISNHLVNNKLAACTNAFAIDSFFNWKDKNTKAKEVAILIKSQSKHQKAIEQAIEKLHSYDVPCILSIPAVANEAYHTWIHEQT